MTSSNPKIKYRTQPFFGEWQFCGLFYLPEASALRGMDHARIDHVIGIRQQWHNRHINFGGSWNSRFSRVDITPKVIDDVHAMCDFLLGDSVPKKIVIHSNHLYIYTNDLNLLERIQRLGRGQMVESTQVELSGQPGTIVLKNPRYQHRSYLREFRMEPKIADAVHKFLINQDSIRLSPSLKWWADMGYLRAMSYYFLDHNDSGILTMISMIEPNLIRKTVPITAAK